MKKSMKCWAKIKKSRVEGLKERIKLDRDWHQYIMTERHSCGDHNSALYVDGVEVLNFRYGFIQAFNKKLDRFIENNVEKLLNFLLGISVGALLVLVLYLMS